MPQKTNITTNYDPTIIIHGKGAHVKKELKRKGATETRTKWDSTKSVALQKLDDSSEGGSIKRVSRKISQGIIQARTQKGWNRKQLALQIQQNVKVVEEFETGKAKYDIKLIHKFERKLGIKLTGNEFK